MDESRALEVLGLSPCLPFSFDEVRRRYRELVKTHHPDKQQQKSKEKQRRERELETLPCSYTSVAVCGSDKKNQAEREKEFDGQTREHPPSPFFTFRETPSNAKDKFQTIQEAFEVLRRSDGRRRQKEAQTPELLSVLPQRDVVRCVAVWTEPSWGLEGAVAFAVDTGSVCVHTVSHLFGSAENENEKGRSDKQLVLGLLGERGGEGRGVEGEGEEGGRQRMQNRTWYDHSAVVSCLAFSRTLGEEGEGIGSAQEGKRDEREDGVLLLFCGSIDGSVWLWVVLSGVCAGRVIGSSESPVFGVAVTEGGLRCAAAGGDGTLILWERCLSVDDEDLRFLAETNGGGDREEVDAEGGRERTAERGSLSGVAPEWRAGKEMGVEALRAACGGLEGVTFANKDMELGGVDCDDFLFLVGTAGVTLFDFREGTPVSRTLEDESLFAVACCGPVVICGGKAGVAFVLRTLVRGDGVPEGVCAHPEGGSTALHLEVVGHLDHTEPVLSVFCCPSGSFYVPGRGGVTEGEEKGKESAAGGLVLLGAESGSVSGWDVCLRRSSSSSSSCFDDHVERGTGGLRSCASPDDHGAEAVEDPEPHPNDSQYVERESNEAIDEKPEGDLKKFVGVSSSSSSSSLQFELSSRLVVSLSVESSGTSAARACVRKTSCGAGAKSADVLSVAGWCVSGRVDAPPCVSGRVDAAPYEVEGKGKNAAQIEKEEENRERVKTCGGRGKPSEGRVAEESFSLRDPLNRLQGGPPVASGGLDRPCIQVSPLQVEADNGGSQRETHFVTHLCASAPASCDANAVPPSSSVSSSLSRLAAGDFSTSAGEDKGTAAAAAEKAAERLQVSPGEGEAHRRMISCRDNTCLLLLAMSDRDVGLSLWKVRL